MRYLRQLRSLQVLVLVFLTACIWPSRGKLRSLTQEESDRHDRIQAKLLKIREQYPSQFHEVLNDIGARMSKMVTTPEKIATAPALKFYLNSLPGGGKSTFVERVVDAIEAHEQYTPKIISPDKFRYLDFNPIIDYAMDLQQIEDRNVQPGVLFFDEYQNALGHQPPEVAEEVNEGFEDALQDLRNRLDQTNAVIEQLKSTAGTDSPDSPRLAEMLAVNQNSANDLSRMLTHHEEMKQEYKSKKEQHDTWMAEAQRQFDIFWQAMGGGQVSSEVAENVGQAAANFSQAINDLNLKRLAYIEKQLAELQAQNVLESIRKKLKRELDAIHREQKRAAEKAGAQSRRPRERSPSEASSPAPDEGVDNSGSDDQGMNLSSRPIPADGENEFGEDLTIGHVLRKHHHHEPTGPTPEDYKAYQEQNEDFKRATTLLQSASEKVDAAREALNSYLDDTFSKAADTFAKSAPVTARKLVQPIKWDEDHWRVRVFNALGDVEAKSKSRSSGQKRSKASLQEDLIESLNSGTVSIRLYWYARVDAGDLSDKVQKIAENPNSQKTKTQFAGNIIVFFAGNIIDIQNSVTQVLIPPKPGEDDSEFNGSLKTINDYCIDDGKKVTEQGVPKLSLYRDPDCLQKVVNEIANSDDGQNAIEEAIKAPFRAFVKNPAKTKRKNIQVLDESDYQKAVDKGPPGSRKNPIALNELAFLSRLGMHRRIENKLGGFPFLLPPDSLAFRNFIVRELGFLKDRFEMLVSAGAYGKELENLSPRFKQQIKDNGVYSEQKPTVVLTWDDAIVNAFYRRYVAGFWGFRWLSDKSAGLLDSPVTGIMKNDVRQRIGAAIGAPDPSQNCNPAEGAAFTQTRNELVDAVPDRVHLVYNDQLGTLSFEYYRSYPDTITGSSPAQIANDLRFEVKDLLDAGGNVAGILTRNREMLLATYFASEFFIQPFVFGTMTDDEIELRMKSEADEGQLIASTRRISGWEPDPLNVQYNYRYLLSHAAAAAGYRTILGANNYAPSAEVNARAQQFLKVAEEFYYFLTIRAGATSFENAKDYLRVPISRWEPEKQLIDEPVIKLMLPAIEANRELSRETRKKMYIAAVKQLEEMFKGRGRALLPFLQNAYDLVLEDIRRSKREGLNYVNPQKLKYLFVAMEDEVLDAFSPTNAQLIPYINGAVAGQFAVQSCAIQAKGIEFMERELTDWELEELERLRQLAKENRRRFEQEYERRLAIMGWVAKATEASAYLFPLTASAVFKYGPQLMEVLQQSITTTQ